jgi:hypothetical protein
VNVTLARLDWSRWKARARRILVRVRQRVPPGLRLLLGIVLMIGGVFAVLPVLGLWMLPLGFAVAALDIRSIRQWLQRRKRRR